MPACHQHEKPQGSRLRPALQESATCTARTTGKTAVGQGAPADAAGAHSRTHAVVALTLSATAAGGGDDARSNGGYA